MGIMGIFLIMGNAGCISSTVVMIAPFCSRFLGFATGLAQAVLVLGLTARVCLPSGLRV